MNEDEIQKLIDDAMAGLKDKISTLTKRLDAFSTAADLPFDVENALSERLTIPSGLEVSSKGKDTEDREIDEGASDVFNVATEYDGFLELTIAGVIYYLGFYD